MELIGEQIVKAGQVQTWQALNDPEILRQCIQGCESIVLLEDGSYTVEMSTRIGPVSAKFKGRLRLTDVCPPDSYSLEFEGQGGAAGFAKGKASVRLEPTADQTILRYVAKASVGGKLAQVGSRLIDSAARQIAEKFFARFDEIVSPTELTPKSADGPELIKSDDEPKLKPAPGQVVRWAWAATTLIVVLALVIAFTLS